MIESMISNNLLDGKVAVVTGAGRGLGREYALALAASGAKVVVNDFGALVNGHKDSGNQADLVVKEIIERGGDAIQLRESIVHEAVSHFGGLDVIVNNAGNNRQSSLVELSEEDIDTQLDVHLKGTLSVSHFAAKYWNEIGPSANRAIINTRCLDFIIFS